MSYSPSKEHCDEDDYILIAKLDNARTMSNILKAIHFKESAIVFASENGLKVTVEDAKCVQANAFLQAGLFQDFQIKEEQVTFKVNLTVLLDCLNIFGSTSIQGITTSLKMCYGGYGHPLVLVLEETGVSTDCSIKTQEPEETLDFNFSSTNVINKIIMKVSMYNSFTQVDPPVLFLPVTVCSVLVVQSECLKEAFSELDMSSEVLQILMSPDKPFLRLSTFGNAGSTHSDYAKDSDMVESFACTQTQSNRYKINLLKPSVKALMLSSRISIRSDYRGFLSMQYMIKAEDSQVCFVEYFCAPDDVEEEEEEEVPALD